VSKTRVRRENHQTAAITDNLYHVSMTRDCHKHTKYPLSRTETPVFVRETWYFPILWLSLAMHNVAKNCSKVDKLT